MDKMQRRANTAPININVGMDKQARLLKELDQAEIWIRAERERIGKRRDSEQTKYNIAVNLGSQTTLATKVHHATRSIFAEWNYEAEVPKLLHALQLIRKLKAAINGGYRLREESDVELAFVRKVMRGITS
jgi:hypothetical protein